MIAKQNISLKEYNTFGIDVLAQSFFSVTTKEELLSSLQILDNTQDLFILGGGSNMLLTKDIEQPVVHINLKGKHIVERNDDWAIVEAAAGENWHEFVLWTLEQNLGGIENLSLIPGNCGAAPIQNIGAYGVELKDVFVSCEAIEKASGKVVLFDKEACAFDYRDSIFKNEAKNKYIITSIRLKLTTSHHHIHDGYGAIKSELEKKQITAPSIQDISAAVIAIRQSKLPDPKDIGNSGSFFKNPVIKKSHFEKLQQQFQTIPSYPVNDDHIKVPAGWLIERAGFKGKRLGAYGVHEKQALVLVNHGEAKGEDIKQLAFLIRKTIHRLFGIELEVEVNIF